MFELQQFLKGWPIQLAVSFEHLKNISMSQYVVHWPHIALDQTSTSCLMKHKTNGSNHASTIAVSLWRLINI